MTSMPHLRPRHQFSTIFDWALQLSNGGVMTGKSAHKLVEKADHGKMKAPRRGTAVSDRVPRGGPKRSKALEDFGRFLGDIRLAKKAFPTQTAAAKKLAEEGLVGINQSLLGKYESGWITDPNPRVLRPLANLYDVPYLQVIASLAENKYRP